MANKPQDSNVTEGAHGAASPWSQIQQQRRAALFTVLAQIPYGAVTSYGQLAEFAGLGRAARWVGRTLSQLPADSQLPWHRVIAANGRLSLPANTPSGAEQRLRLMDEGIFIRNDRIDLRHYGWRPMEHSG